MCFIFTQVDLKLNQQCISISRFDCISYTKDLVVTLEDRYQALINMCTANKYYILPNSYQKINLNLFPLLANNECITLF